MKQNYRDNLNLLKKNIGQELFLLRQCRGYSLEKVARCLNIRQIKLERIELGLANVKLEVVVMIAMYYKSSTRPKTDLKRFTRMVVRSSG